MNEVYELAHVKLLEEMKNNDDENIEEIHVWLNQNMDDKIAAGISKPERTLQSCWEYVFSRAKEEYTKKHGNKNGGFRVGNKVFDWVRDFYTLDNIEVKEPKKIHKKETKKIKAIKKNEKVKKPAAEQLELF